MKALRKLRARVPLSPGTTSRRILVNSGWNLAQQMLTMISGSVIGILLVRALPVEQYGVYSYAVAAAALGASVMTAGLSGLAVKEIVDNPHDSPGIVAGLLLVREAFALIGYLIIGIVTWITADPHLMWAALLASLMLFGRALEAPDFWYLAKLQSRKTVTIRVTVTAIMLLLRLVGMLFFSSAIPFLVIYAVEAIAVGGLILARYLMSDETGGLGKPQLTAVRRMTSQSLPLMLSSVAGQINLRGDIVIIQSILGLSSVSIYAAAARISELSYFLPIIAMNSLFPSILTIRKTQGPESRKYQKTLQRAYDAAFWIGVAAATATVVAGLLIITYVFGPSYTASKEVLYIHVLACPFMFMAAVYSKWIIAENILWTSLLRHSLGAIANVVLCVILIPRMGVTGAAWATVISYVTASYLSCFVGGRKNRQAGLAMTRAIVAPFRYAGVIARLKG